MSSSVSVVKSPRKVCMPISLSVIRNRLLPVRRSAAGIPTSCEMTRLSVCLSACGVTTSGQIQSPATKPAISAILLRYFSSSN